MIWESPHNLVEALGHPNVVTSGHFDMLHAGHTRLILASAMYGELTVIVNGDEAARRKKGYVFMPLAERMEIVAAIFGVCHVIPWEEDNVAGALEVLKSKIFTKGGDRTATTMAPEEVAVCEHIGCRIIYGVGGGKIQSSSALVEKLCSTGR